MSSTGKLRVALIGCGRIGQVHAERLATDSRVVVVAVCDPSADAAAALRQRCAPYAAVGTDVDATLNSEAIDAVVIASPTPQHFPQSMLALQRGLHVLCEKPLAETRTQILDLIELRLQARRTLTVSYQRRYQAAYRTAKRELARPDGFYGPVRQVHIFVCERWLQTILGTWRDRPAVGGYFADAGIHQLDSCCYITGLRPESVYARSDQRGSSVEIVTEVMATMTGGVRLLAHFVGDASHWREDMHFHCQHADLLIRNCELIRCRDNAVELLPSTEGESTPDVAFVDEILSGIASATPAENSLLTYDWTHAVLRSIRDRRWMSVPSENA